MTLREELDELLAVIVAATANEDITPELEQLGIHEHDSLREFVVGYGAEIVQVLGEETNFAEAVSSDLLAEHFSAALLAGFLIGLKYAATHP